jgi:hypothetical protein
VGDLIATLNGQPVEYNTFSAQVANATGGRNNRLQLLIDGDGMQTLDFRCGEECKL